MHKKHIESVQNLHQTGDSVLPTSSIPRWGDYTPRPPGRGIGANWNSKVMTSCGCNPGHWKNTSFSLDFFGLRIKVTLLNVHVIFFFWKPPKKIINYLETFHFFLQNLLLFDKILSSKTYYWWAKILTKAVCSSPILPVLISFTEK